jgi:hypothetical protein
MRRDTLTTAIRIKKEQGVPLMPKSKGLWDRGI